MFRGAVFHPPNHDEGGNWNSVIAVVFAVAAVISFAVDLTVSLSASTSKAPAAQVRPIVR